MSQSDKLFAEAKKYIPGGVNSPVRAFNGVGGNPVFFKKGEGAYYSSGSRPNQTARSWGIARLASAITGGKSSKVDYHLLKQCNHTKKAYKLAIPSTKQK